MNEQERHITVWQDCLRHIAQIIGEQQANTWFRPIRPVSLVESRLTLEVPSDFVRQYIEEAYLDVIRMVLRKVIGADARLSYNIRQVSSQPALKVSAQTAMQPVNKPVEITSGKTFGNPSALVYPGLQRGIQIDPRLNPVYTFDNLVKGDCNKIGITAGQTIAAAPGRSAFNPLFIFGGPGLGKTHLAQAIGLAIKEKHPDLVVLYVSGHDFKTQYMDATNGKNMLLEFISYYMKIDVLIVDDIQELLGTGSQNAFFNIFNYLQQNNKQLVLASDRPAVELHNFEERLVSRFKWGLSIQLTTPDYETRLAMLHSRCQRDGIALDEPTLEYLASHIRSNFRELEGALLSVMVYSTGDPGRSTLEIAEEVTRTIVGENMNELNIDSIKNTVCEYFSITADDIVSKSRKRQIVQARQIAMYLCRNLISNCSLSTIGAQIGGKDHATVLHSYCTVQDLMSTDKSFKRYVSDLENILKPSNR